MTTSAAKRGAVKRRPAAKRFHWFQGASVRELYNQLSAAGPDTARLEVHTTGDQMTFLVHPGEVSTQSHNPSHINDSHICPPDCPPK